MKLDDYVGEIRVSAEDAITYVKTWFNKDDKIVVVGRRNIKSGNLDTLSQSFLAHEFIQNMNDDFLRDLIFGEDGSKWNLYIGVSPVKEDVTLRRRGTEDNVQYIPGVYADIDIKEKGFNSQEEILEFLDTLALKPTMICGSGSGGVHAYWRLHWDQQGDKELVERWWSYLDESAGEKQIDKLVDLTRILRIPGTVYFPKEGSGNKIGHVSILKINRFPNGQAVTYDRKQMADVSEEAFNTKGEKRKKLIQKDSQRRFDADNFARGVIEANKGGNRWKLYRAISEMEGYVNNKIEWAEILEPHGWTFRRKLRDGSNEWARPGRKERSAVVDFEDSPVMSLLSRAQETGLSDLLDAQLPLTKYRVMLRLQYEDDEQRMVSDLLDRLMNEGVV